MLYYKKMDNFGNTEISVNKGRANAILAIASGHNSSGNSSIAKVSMLRTGIDGNILQESVIAESKGHNSYAIDYSLSNGKIQVSGTGVVSPSIILIATSGL